MRIVEFHCPGCFTQIETEYLPPGHPITHDIEIDLDRLRERLDAGELEIRDERLGGAMNTIDIDVGGTFTDLVLTLDGETSYRKVPTTPYDLSVGFMQVVEEAADEAGAVARGPRAARSRPSATRPPWR